MKRRDAHLAIARAYGTAAGDAIKLAIDRVASGQTTLKTIWPLDGVHPCDAGYVLFADAAWTALQDAIRCRQVCRVPDKPLYGDTYWTTARVRISSLGPPPAGWHVGLPNPEARYFDMQMSRWLDDETIAQSQREITAADGKTSAKPQPVERLQVKFSGRLVMLLGEATPASGAYRVYIDGRAVQHTPSGAKDPTDKFDAGAFARRLGGNAHHAQVIATGLDPETEHTLQIEPLFAADARQELRLESICVAGGRAMVRAFPLRRGDQDTAGQ